MPSIHGSTLGMGSCEKQEFDTDRHLNERIYNA